MVRDSSLSKSSRVYGWVQKKLRASVGIPKLVGKAWTPRGRAQAKRKLRKWHRPLLVDLLPFLGPSLFSLPWRGVEAPLIPPVPRNSLWCSLRCPLPRGG